MSSKLSELSDKLGITRGGNARPSGFGEDAFSEEMLKKILAMQEREKYTLDPSMGDQKLRVPKSYQPGGAGGGVHFSGGSPFKVDKTDQRILAEGAMVKTLQDKGLFDAIRGMIGGNQSGDPVPTSNRGPSPNTGRSIENNYYSGNYPTGDQSRDPTEDQYSEGITASSPGLDHPSQVGAGMSPEEMRAYLELLAQQLE